MAGLLACALAAQTPPAQPSVTASSFQGSVPQGAVSEQPVALTLDDAMQRSLKANLGVILSGAQTAAERGKRISRRTSLWGLERLQTNPSAVRKAKAVPLQIRPELPQTELFSVL
jgi:hypothetical protein